MKKEYKASISVEAGFVLPMVIFIIVLLLEFALIWHDRIVMEGIVLSKQQELLDTLAGKEKGNYNFAALSGRRLYFNSYEEVFKRAEEAILKNAGERLLFSRLASTDVKKGLEGLTIRVTLEHRDLLPLLSKLYGKKSLRYEESYALYERENKTRLATVIFEMLGKYSIFDYMGGT